MRSVVSRVLLIGVAAALAAAPVMASGFNIYEQGAKASAQAVAFVARADDPTAGYYNPAAITKLEGTQVSFGFSAVLIGDTQLDIAPGTIYTPGRYDMEDNTGFPPHVFVTHNFDNGWAIVGSLTAPFGLKTEWSESFGGRYSARTSDLAVAVLGLGVARDLGSGWSVALGVEYADVQLDEFARNVFLPGIAIPPIPVPDGMGGTIPVTPTPVLPIGGITEPLTNLVADGNDVGFNASIHFRNDEWAFGAIYRDGFEADLDGNVLFSNKFANLNPMVPVWTNDILTAIPTYDPTTAAAVAQGYADGVNASLQAAFTNGPGSGTLTLPGNWAIGLAYLGWERFELELDIATIMWGDFKEIPLVLPTGPEVIEENWSDATTIRLGGAYKLNDLHELRAGIYTDEDPIPDAHARPSIPDSDRLGFTFGYGYLGEKWSIDAYVMYITLDDKTIDVSNFAGDPSVVPGKYESTVTLIGLTGTYRY
ncbi:MAG: hypothetical protein D6738_11305 [Acidobacteria bacterium]|nr:MAG: hypothetical protein D6738_11305 [Acidobacteriota bacterium]